MVAELLELTELRELYIPGKKQGKRRVPGGFWLVVCMCLLQTSKIVVKDEMFAF